MMSSMVARTVNFELTCVYCGKRLTGEPIKEISWRRFLVFFYTESGHQLCYEGPRLSAIHCLETLDGEVIDGV